MKTYQDLLEVGEFEEQRINFVQQCINEFKVSDIYRDADIAYQYAKKKNVTINEYQKLLYTVSGNVVPDSIKSAGYSDWNSLFISQHYGDWPSPEIFFINVRTS